MIEPTDDLRRAAYDALPPEVRIAPAVLDEVLAAVLAIVDRDRCMRPSGHGPLAECGAPGPGGLTCQRQPHAWKRESLHGAVRPGELVTW